MSNYKGHVHDDEMRELAEDLAERRETQMVKGHGHEIEVTLVMPNPMWGLPSEIENLLGLFGACIDDFSHVTGEQITIYLAQRDSE